MFLRSTAQVDVLVHNAARGARSLIEKASIDVDRAIMDVNTFGTISLTKAVLPYMIQRQKGDIVVVSSGIGKFGKHLLFIWLTVPNEMYETIVIFVIIVVSIHTCHEAFPESITLSGLIL